MEDIAALVLSLSPSEKQHFKKRHNPTADFVVLFDYINKKKSCLTPDVLAHLSKKLDNKKSINSSYLAVIKTYLKNRILESLRIQFIHKRKNYELLSRSMNADILLEKGLYSLAKKEIDISSNKNMESSFPIEKLLLLRRRSILDYFENYSNTNLEGIEALYNDRLETTEQLLLEIKFARILSIMSFQYFNGLNDPEILKSFMSEPYMQDESLSTDFATKYLFHWVHAQFQEFQNNNEKALEHFNKSIRIWINNPKYIQAHPRMYLGACFTYFKYLIHQKDPFSNLLSDINFDVLNAKIETENLSIEEKDKHFILFNLYKILSFRQQGKSREIVFVIETLCENDLYIDQIPTFERVIFCYYNAFANFDCGDLDEAQNALFDLLNPLDKRLSTSPVYISVCIMLHIMILIERENEKHLRQLLPKYKKYLSQEGKLSDFENNFFSMASQLISSRFKPSPELVYQRFHKRLSQTQESDERGIKIEYDYIISWVKKKEQELNL